MHNSLQNKITFYFVWRFALHLDMEKSLSIQIRVTEAEKEGFTLAADLAGITLSAWIRERLRLTAIRELESAGRQIPFVESVPLKKETK